MLRLLKILCLATTFTVLAAGIGTAWLSRLALSQMQEEEVHGYGTCTSQHRQTVNIISRRLTGRNLAAVLRFSPERVLRQWPLASTLGGAEHSLRNGCGLPLLC